MSTPEGMRAWVRSLAAGGQIHIYSNAERIILQLRRAVPTAEDVLAPSFKVALELSPRDALALASELIASAVRELEREPQAQGLLPAEAPVPE
jgi:hypothetical protein